MSGRSLRRLPVLAHARYIGTTAMVPQRASHPPNGVLDKALLERNPGTDVAVWLDAMDRVVESQGAERVRLNQ